jgi:hypothetical protein
MNPDATIPVIAIKNSVSATLSSTTINDSRLILSAKKITYVQIKNSSAEIASTSSAIVSVMVVLPMVWNSVTPVIQSPARVPDTDRRYSNSSRRQVPLTDLTDSIEPSSKVEKFDLNPQLVDPPGRALDYRKMRSRRMFATMEA